MKFCIIIISLSALIDSWAAQLLLPSFTGPLSASLHSSESANKKKDKCVVSCESGSQMAHWPWTVARCAPVCSCFPRTSSAAPVCNLPSTNTPTSTTSMMQRSGRRYSLRVASYCTCWTGEDEAERVRDAPVVVLVFVTVDDKRGGC